MPPRRSRQPRVTPKEASATRAGQVMPTSRRSKRNTADGDADGATALHDVAALVAKAETYVTEQNLDLAAQFAARALERDPDHVGAIEVQALIALQSGDGDTAHELLQRCVALSPEEGHSKYLYLGQLLSGEEAAAMLGKGIELLAAQAEEVATGGEGTDEELGTINEEIAAAFCSLAEVYLTDLCEVDDAQNICLTLMKKALQYDPENPQTLQTLASIHISMQQPDDAKACMEQSLLLWMTPEAEEGADADELEGDVHDMPPYEFRINASKILLELNQIDTALEVLDQLLAEDDTIMQVWYLQGWALHLAEDMECVQSLQQARDAYHRNGCERPEVLEHIEELLALHTGDGGAAAAASSAATEAAAATA